MLMNCIQRVLSCRLVFGFALVFSVALGHAEVKRPNIVWLISEDNSVHYSKLYFETGAEMPNIEELADEGILFNHAFSVAPVCSVARSTLATGSYPSRLGMQFHRGDERAVLPEDVVPVFELMHNAGYYTSYWKKNDFNFESDTSKWNVDGDWSGRADGQPFFHKHQIQITHESNLQRANVGGTEDQEFVLPRHPNTPLFRQAQQAYLKLNEMMDQQAGELVDRLRSEGVLEDTFIFYFGDHGGVLPGSKGYLYETGLHVPFVVRIPNNFRDLVDLESGTSTDGFIEFVDVGPTTLHLAGLPVPAGMDGKPFMGPGVSGEELELRDEAIGIADRFDEKYDLVRSLRKGNLKYIRNYTPFNFHGMSNIYRYKMASFREWRDLHEAGQLGELQNRFFATRPAEELYDVVKDPYETVNLAMDPAHADALGELRTRLATRLKAMPDLSFIPERDLVDQAIEAPVVFGEANRERIAGLIDIADLMCLPYTDAKAGLEKALSSHDAVERYWGLIACSVFQEEAVDFADSAREIAIADSDLLVRARAAQFLALIKEAEPHAVLLDVLAQSESAMETTQILNIITMLQDGEMGYNFELDPDQIRTRGYFVDRCLVHLCGIPAPTKPAKLTKP
jgi:arylsulfatase A-like enzyme